MNLGTMIERTYDGLRDYQREFVLVEEVTAWLNEAQRDLAHRTKVLRKEVTQATTAISTAGSVPLPSDFLQAVSLRFGNTDVTWVDDARFFDLQDAAVTNPIEGDYVGRIFGSTIEVWPQIAAGSSYTLRYVYEPSDMDDETDTPALPTEYHIKMVFYARSQGFLRINELDQASSAMDMYERGLPTPTYSMHEQVPMPSQLRYEPGPFDAEGVHRG